MVKVSISLWSFWVKIQKVFDSDLKDDSFINAKDKDVIVIGGGDTGNDCLVHPLRHGCKSLTNFEILPELPERLDNNPWPIFPRVYKVDYGHEESRSLRERSKRIFCFWKRVFKR